MSKKLQDFFEGMSEENQNRFMVMSKEFPLFAVEPDMSSEYEEMTILFLFTEDSIFIDEKSKTYRINENNRSLYTLINTSSTKPLARGIYQKSDLPFFDVKAYSESFIESKSIIFDDMKSLPTIKEENELSVFFPAIVEHLSFSDMNAIGYNDDSKFQIETIFEIKGSHDGNGSSSVKRILFDGDIVLYANYKGKYGDEPTAYVVNKEAYKDLLKYVESKYNDEKIELNELNTKIYGKFSSAFYDFVEKEIK